MFKGERLQNDYIKKCKLKICITMQKKTWMTTFIVRRVISQTNQHLLILYGCGSHVTLEAIKQAHLFELDIIITFLIIPFTHYSP